MAKKDNKAVFDVQEDVGNLKIFIKKPLGRKKNEYTEESTYIDNIPVEMEGHGLMRTERRILFLIEENSTAS